MSEEDEFDMLLDDDDLAAATDLSDQTTGLQRPGLGGTTENGGACGSGDDGGDGGKDGGGREWTTEEMKLVEPCIELIKVSDGGLFLLKLASIFSKDHCMYNNYATFRIRICSWNIDHYDWAKLNILCHIFLLCPQ